LELDFYPIPLFNFFQRVFGHLKKCGFSLQEIKVLFEWSQNTDENDELTEAEIQNLQQMKLLFQYKYKQVIQREKEIKQIKQALQRADNKMEQLLEKNKGVLIKITVSFKNPDNLPLCEKCTELTIGQSGTSLTQKTRLCFLKYRIHSFRKDL